MARLQNIFSGNIPHKLSAYERNKPMAGLNEEFALPKPSSAGKHHLTAEQLESYRNLYQNNSPDILSTIAKKLALPDIDLFNMGRWQESLMDALKDISKPKAHDNINSLIQQNISEGDLSQESLLEMIMPFGAMGRVAKTAPKIGRGIIEASKGMGRRGVENQTLKQLSKDTRLKGPEYDAGDDFFKRTIRNLFESMEGKEF